MICKVDTCFLVVLAIPVKGLLPYKLSTTVLVLSNWSSQFSSSRCGAVVGHHLPHCTGECQSTSLSIAVIQHPDLETKVLDLCFQTTVHHWGKSEQEPKHESKVKTEVMLLAGLLTDLCSTSCCILLSFTSLDMLSLTMGWVPCTNKQETPPQVCSQASSI